MIQDQQSDKAVKPIYYDGYLKQNLDVMKKVIKKDWDMTILIDGIEGGGKSVLGLQVGYYLDPTLNLDRVVFTAEEFKKAVIKAEKYQVIIFDEAFRGLSSRSAMSETNKKIVEMLAEIRQKNLYIIIICPTFFDLDKFAALWRSRILLHVYTSTNFERGYFRFFNYQRKKNLYVNGKKFYNYSCGKPNFIGRFSSACPLNQEEYRNKKYSALQNTKAIEEPKYKLQRNALIFELNQVVGFSQVKISEILNKYGFDFTNQGINAIVSNIKNKK